MKKETRKISDFKDDKSVLRSDLLSHVLGGLMIEDGRCDCDTCKYNDTVYVRPPDVPKKVD